MIPIKLVFNSFGGATFDPTAADATCSPKGTALLLTQKSPIFNDITLAHVGTGQYVSLFQRANYFTINKHYTVELQPTTLGVQQIGVNGGNVRPEYAVRQGRLSRYRVMERVTCGIT